MHRININALKRRLIRVDAIPERLSYYLIVVLRFCALRYRSVTLKCGVGRLVGVLMNGGRCTHGGVSSSGELSPKISGVRSELSDGPSPRRLGSKL